MVVERWVETATADVFKDGARFLQHRIKHRLRVAVDHHRLSPVFPNHYFNSRFQRWLDRFRDFRRDTLPSSTTFYRKKVSEDVDSESDSMLTRMLQAVAVPVLGHVCHVFMHGLNRVQIYGAEKLHEAVLHREQNKSLVTVSNHVAAVDDPLVIASLLPSSVLLDAYKLRWTLCATDRCFRNPVTSAIFKHVKVLPVSRGGGIYQKGMDVAISKLNRGEWVHIFPEGSRSRDGGKNIGQVKRGIGRMILDADNAPIVLPFVHSGMQDVMPIGAKLPRIGKTVTVLVGDPISFDDLFKAEKDQKLSREKLYDAISLRIQDRLQKLKVQVDRLWSEQSLESQNDPTKVTDKSAEEYARLEVPLSSNRQSSLLESDAERSSSEGQISTAGFFKDDGIFSRIRRLESTELLAFAARRLLNNNADSENSVKTQGISRLRVWNDFHEAVHEDYALSTSNLWR